LAAYRKLRASKFFGAEDSGVLFNTGSGWKYLDVIEDVIENEMRRAVPVQGSRQIGGRRVGGKNT
jgi:threonine synthase